MGVTQSVRKVLEKRKISVYLLLLINLISLFGVTGIPFGQPILVGHHSERAHRKVLERADNAMRKGIEESKKADNYRARAEYWESRENIVNLSMPESIE